MPTQQLRMPSHVIIYRSLRSVTPHLILALAVGGLGIFLAQMTSVFDARVSLNEGAIQLPLFLLLFLFLAVRPVILLYDERCDISANHIRHTAGLFSLKRRDIAIPFEDLRGVKVEQKLIDRLLGVGQLIAWTHAASNPEIRMPGIKHPRKTAALISTRIDEALLRRSE